jgi:hypothetical protein
VLAGHAKWPCIICAMRNPSRHVLAIVSVTAAALLSAEARADDTIKHPGEHPQYSVELEPHLLIGWDANYYYGSGDGFGLGGRVSINLTHNGFVQSINNSVAIGLGIDWVHYDAPACFYYYNRGAGCYGGVSADFFQFPVVMQWNFYVAKHWSVFGEPGLYIWHGSYGNGACYNPAGVLVNCSYSDTGVGPAFWVGGRYHFNETVALTLRLGFPDLLTVGVSFML